jgi:hypothetical protein
MPDPQPTTIPVQPSHVPTTNEQEAYAAGWVAGWQAAWIAAHFAYAGGKL